MFGIKGAEKKQILGLTVTPNLGLEACVFNKDTGEVEKYAQKFLEYNIASKEIQDMNAFRSAVSDMFNELDVSKENAGVYLVLPNVYFGFRSFDGSGIDDEAVLSMILSETSDSYIFKQEEPQSAWVDMNAKTGSLTKYIAYSSIQKKAVEAIEDACMDIGASLLGVESATTALPRGIALSKICDDVISNNENWDILLINPNGYSIFQMSGSRLLDYLEVPFAIMSFEGDEVYSALSSAVGQYLPNYPAKKLVIASLTDNVSAKALKNELVFNEEILTVDSNKFGSAPCAPIADTVLKQSASSMSLNVLGASCPKFGGFATLNVLGETSYDGNISYGTFELGDKEIDLNSELISKVSIISSIVLGVLIVLICGALFLAGMFFGSRASALQDEINSLEDQIKTLSAQLQTGVVPLIKKITENNKTSINYYDSLASDIPSHLWLTYYLNRGGNDVAIEGFSMKINDIYEYYKSLKMLAPQSQIKLNRLEVFKEESTGSSDADDIVLNEDNKQQIFSFEISSVFQYTKSFDDNGNKITGEEGSQQSKKNKNQTSSYAARIPDVPDVEINLKEIK